MQHKHHIFPLAIALCAASSAAIFAQTNSSPQFIAAKQLVIHNPSNCLTGIDNIMAVADFTGDHRPDILGLGANACSETFVPVLAIQNSDGTFTARAIPIAALANDPFASPSSLAAVDMNGDGILDLVIAIPSDSNEIGQPLNNSTITVYLGNGDGTFREYASFSPGPYVALTVSVADLNGDGKPDLLAQIQGASGGLVVQAYRNEGGGRFRAAGQVAGLLLASGDFRGDGRADLVVTNDQPSGSGAEASFQIYKGNGNGTFTAGTVYQLPVSMVAVGDLNGDHNLDLVVLNQKNSNVLLGNGDGTFRSAGTVPTSLFNAATVPSIFGPQPLVTATNIFFGDFDRDGNVDLAVVSYANGFNPNQDFDATHGLVAIYPGNGTGTFRDPRVYNLGPEEGGLSAAIADVTGDGNLDVLSLTDRLWLLKGDGYGSLDGPITSLSYTPTSMAAADFNRDGIPDIAVVNPGTCDKCNGTVSVFPGSGKGYLDPAKIYPIGMHDGVVTVGDVNRDGKLDLVVTRRGSIGQPGQEVGPAYVSVLLGNGDGTFQRAIDSTVLGPPAAGVDDTSAFLVDINHDGRLDLVGDWGVAFGKGNGNFEAPIPLPSGIDRIEAMALADFNRDGNPDLAVATYQSTDGSSPAVLYTLLGNGRGSFRIVQRQQIANVADFGAIAAADLNKDGIPDLVFTTAGPQNGPNAFYLNVETGKGDGTFVNFSQQSISVENTAMVIADFNRDGNLDLALSGATGSFNTTSYLELLPGTGRGTFLAPVTYDATMSAMTATYLNADGAPDIAGTTPVGVLRVINTGARSSTASTKPPTK